MAEEVVIPKEAVVPPVVIADAEPSPSSAPPTMPDAPVDGGEVKPGDASKPTEEKIGSVSAPVVTDEVQVAKNREKMNKKLAELFGTIPDEERNKIAKDVKNAASSPEDRVPSDPYAFNVEIYIMMRRVLGEYAPYARYISKQSTIFDIVAAEKDYAKTGTYPSGLLRVPLDDDCFKTRILTAKDVTLANKGIETENWKFICRTVDKDLIVQAAQQILHVCLPGMLMSEMENFDIRLVPERTIQAIVLAIQDAALGPRDEKTVRVKNQFAQAFEDLGKKATDLHGGMVFVIPSSQTCRLDLQRDVSYWLDKLSAIAMSHMIGTIQYRFEAAVAKDVKEDPSLDANKLFEEYRENFIFEYRIERLPDKRWLWFIRVVPRHDMTKESKQRVELFEMSIDDIAALAKEARMTAMKKKIADAKKAKEEAIKKAEAEDEAKKNPTVTTTTAVPEEVQAATATALAQEKAA
jgi:hypothetical protein